MSESWLIRVYNDHVLSYFGECEGPIELGRQDERTGECLFQVARLSQRGSRIAIARSDEVKVSRRLAWLEQVSSHGILVKNISAHVSFGLEGGPQIKPGSEFEAWFPIILTLGSKVVRIEKATEQDLGGTAIQSLETPTEIPMADLDTDSPFSTLDLRESALPDMAGVFSWLRAMIRVLHSAACDADFFQKAAQAVVEVVRLDMGRVLTRDGDGWKTVASYPDASEDDDRNNPPSRLMLSKVCTQKRTSWFDPLGIDENCSSLAGVTSVVAAPVLDRIGNVIAILYGERRLHSLLMAARPVTRLDAMLIEVLALGVSTGLARLEQERAALSLQTQFEQFFTPELARQLASHPELLTGQDQEITVLFCDIRGFSRISRNQGTAFTLEWINDVLSTLSDCVLKHQGVLVDYIGDELMAMWGAPEAQPDHAERACLAALEMIGCLTELNERWEVALGQPMGLGIGINTGLARVGNTGSRRKFKYGPLGDTVNVASRVQGASKYFKSSLLITRETRDRLGPGFPLRRLGTARVVNIADAIELFELFPAGHPDVDELCSAYDEALAAFEAGEFGRATGILGRLVSVHRNDGPSFALLARAIAYIVDEPETFDRAFRLPGK